VKISSGSSISFPRYCLDPLSLALAGKANQSKLVRDAGEMG
jgi:hypothetical protein